LGGWSKRYTFEFAPLGFIIGPKEKIDEIKGGKK
jgi:hypothetical protein